MKTKMVEVREGERLGDIDWSYDFASHCWNENRGGMNPSLLDRSVNCLRIVEAGLKAGKRVQVTTYGDHLEDVVDCGMYDGWPYWKPVPSFQTVNWLGASWHAFASLSSVTVSEPNAGAIT